MSFFGELQRRNVVRVGIAYVVIGWALAQVAELAFDAFAAPDWVLKSFLFVLLLGLPLALFFAWAFEMTPEGVKREKDVDRSQSITTQTGRKLDFIIIAVLAIGIGLLLVDKFMLGGQSAAVDSSANTGDAGVSAEIEVVATEQSIAVLPFVNMSDDKDYFADGLSEELLNLLAKIPDLKVAGRTSSFVFKNKTEDLRAIGDALGVATVLEGSVRRSGDRLRITAQLIKVDDGFHLWSETYDRQMADIFDIQDDVANAIVQALRLQLAPRTARPTDNSDAYALYLEALPYVAVNDDLDILDIVPALLDEAIALDPTFARAYELKALTYWATGGDLIDAAAGQALTYAAATKAIELDPTLTLAGLLADDSNPDQFSWKMMIDAIEEALRAAPDEYNFLRMISNQLLFTGYYKESLSLAQRMVEVEPLSSLGYFRRALAYSALDRRAEARDSFQRAADLGATYYEWSIALDQMAAGEFDAGITTLENMKDEYIGWRPDEAREILAAVSAGENVAAAIGALANDETANTTNALAAGDSNSSSATSTNYWYMVLGYDDEYWQIINDIRAQEESGWSNAEYLYLFGLAHSHSGFSAHPMYLEFAKNEGLIELWDVRGPPDHCSKDSGEWICK
ncbi:MAG: TolB-like protein [Woeseiaceae bacterium]|jgi:TolB-like protein